MVMAGFYPAPEVSLAPLPDLCHDDPPYLLTEGSPPGGVYTGEGVEEGYFYPSIAGAGEHVITYTVTDDLGCSASAEQILTVYDCTLIEDNPETGMIRIVPNPNEGNFFLLIRTGKEGQGRIQLCNSSGIQVFETAMTVSEGINRLMVGTVNLDPGLYILQFEYQGMILYEKVVIR
jgi:hypothetical protein